MGAPARPKLHGMTSLLLDAGVVTDAQVQSALMHQRETGRRIGETLVELGFVTEADIAWALARALDIPFVDLALENLDQGLIRRFPDGMLHRLQAVPLLLTDRHLSVALADPTDSAAAQELERTTRCTLNPSAATPSAIRGALEAVLGDSPETALRPAPLSAGGRFEVEWDRSGATFLLLHLAGARREGASEVHFVPETTSLAVLHRTPSGLTRVTSEPLDVMFSLLARLEALGGPTIDDRVVHASGQVLCPMGNSDLRVDVSLLNCDEGVAVVLGLRPEPAEAPTFESLGLDQLELARVREVLDRPSGLILVSGPVRSGCSTTLACLLSAVATQDRRTVSIDTRPGPPSPAGARLTLTAASAREHWTDIMLGQNVDVAALGDVLPGEHVLAALDGVGSGRLLLVNTDWTDSFALLEYLSEQPHRRAVLARRLHLVIQQRRVPLLQLDGGAESSGPSWQTVFEPLFVTEPMRRALAAHDSADRLRGAAEADGFVSLERRLADLVAAGRLLPVEAARAGA